MDSKKSLVTHNYLVVGIGDPGKYVVETISTFNGIRESLHFHFFKKFADFRMEGIASDDRTRALFLVLQPGDEACDEFIPGIESFVNRTGIPVYVIANYPFLWEGRSRITKANEILKDLRRVCYSVFRIESHQWFPLKEEIGFHKVVELVHEVAAQVVLAIIEHERQALDIEILVSFSINEDLIATKDGGGYWSVKSKDPDNFSLRK